MKPFLIVSSLMALVVGAGVYFTAPCGPCCEAPAPAAPAAAAVVEAAPASAAPQPVAASEAELEAPSACSPCFPDKAVDLERMISAEAEGGRGEAGDCGAAAKPACPSETQPIAAEAQTKDHQAKDCQPQECGTEECPPAECCPDEAKNAQN
ncbi:MAG TPA: hypothetical protein DEA08_15930 [Planctomycetes bacterium]|nr:hypothetical protein [Planctomycetota bacterium]